MSTKVEVSYSVLADTIHDRTVPDVVPYSLLYSMKYGTAVLPIRMLIFHLKFEHRRRVTLFLGPTTPTLGLAAGDELVVQW